MNQSAHDCPDCDEELVHDDEGFVCPNCSSSFWAVRETDAWVLVERR